MKARALFDRAKYYGIVHLWRLEQLRFILGIFFYSAALAAASVELTDWYFREYFGVSNTLYQILITSSVLLVLFYLTGAVYDRVLKLWREDQTVIVNRNPYFQEKFNARYVMAYYPFYVHMLAALRKGADPEAVALADEFQGYMNRWLSSSLEKDPSLVEMLEEARGVFGEHEIDQERLEEFLGKVIEHPELFFSPKTGEE